MDKIAIFIDSGYLDKITIKFGFRIDYKKLIKDVSNKYELFRTYYYYCAPYSSPIPTEVEKKMQSKHSKFIYVMQQIPRLELRKGKLEKRDSFYVQKRVDILLAVDLVRLSWKNQIQAAALITGDSDFVPAVKDAKDSGIITKLYYHKECVHDELKHCCDDTIEITNSVISSWKLI